MVAATMRDGWSAPQRSCRTQGQLRPGHRQALILTGALYPHLTCPSSAAWLSCSGALLLPFVT